MPVTDESFLREHLPVLKEDSDKFRRGRLLMAAGSYGMAGCVILAARAALRTGAGYLVLLLPESIYGIVTQAVPEAVCRVCPDDDTDAFLKLFREEERRADAVLSGCGLGSRAGRITGILLRECTKPWIIDADSLNALALTETVPAQRDLVLTPHEGEAARLLFDGEAMRLPKAEQSAYLRKKEQWIHENRETALDRLTARFPGAAVLLKGPETLIGRSISPGPENMHIEKIMNPHRNPGLGRAGSGDTLSGIIGSLLAQGAKPFEAAAMGAFIHGEAGELARKDLGERSMLPSDIIEKIPEVLR